jgi:hypothetical protein
VRSNDGFYEWKELDPKGKLKQPFAIAMADDAQMVMAGMGEMEITGERRRSLELHDSDVRSEQGDERAARPHAGHPRGDRLAAVARRSTGERARRHPIPE